MRIGKAGRDGYAIVWRADRGQKEWIRICPKPSSQEAIVSSITMGCVWIIALTHFFLNG